MATPTLLPLLPFVKPPEPPVPIRLFEPDTGNPAGDVVGRSSGAGAVGVERDDRIVQSRRKIAADVQTAAIIVGDCAVDGRQRAPDFVNAATDVIIRVGVEFAAMVLLTIVSGPPLTMPPPSPAELFAMVLPVTVAVPLL